MQLRPHSSAWLFVFCGTDLGSLVSLLIPHPDSRTLGLIVVPDVDREACRVGAARRYFGPLRIVAGKSGISESRALIHVLEQLSSSFGARNCGALPSPRREDRDSESPFLLARDSELTKTSKMVFRNGS